MIVDCVNRTTVNKCHHCITVWTGVCQ